LPCYFAPVELESKAEFSGAGHGRQETEEKEKRLLRHVLIEPSNMRAVQSTSMMRVGKKFVRLGCVGRDSSHQGWSRNCSCRSPQRPASSPNSNQKELLSTPAFDEPDVKSLWKGLEMRRRTVEGS